MVQKILDYDNGDAYHAHELLPGRQHFRLGDAVVAAQEDNAI